MPVSVWVSTSSGGADIGGGAIACVEIAGEAESIDQLMTALGVEPVVAGTVRRRKVPLEAASTLRGAAESPIVDDTVIGRWSPGRATVMTHGGRAVVDGFISACRSWGASVSHPVDLYPEAVSKVESSMLAALAQAASPAAVDLLLDQPRRWARLDPGRHMTDHRDRLLKRLIVPALVVAVGPPNIGKSSLLNALAGRRVAVVADEPGTTRDHVGALIDLQGVVVRWVDTPGVDEPARGQQSEFSGGPRAPGDEQIQNEAQRLAAVVAAQADVVVACEDAATSAVVSDRVQSLRIKDGALVVRVKLRADLHAHRSPDADGALLVSSLSGEGMSSLVAAVREAVVPARLLGDGLAWRFWEG